MQNKLYTANTIRQGVTKPTLQLGYGKEHKIVYKPVKVCMYNLRWAYLPNTCLLLTSYFFSFKSSLLKLSLFLTSSAPNYWKRLKIHCRAKTDNDWFLYIDQAKSSAWQIYLFVLDSIYRGSLFSIFTTLIYHKVLINNKTEQDTKQDKQTNILVEQLTYILTWYIWTV